jgi:hypothetical protein
MQRASGIRNECAFAGVLIALACLRVCFAGVLWSDEDYHMAAAIQLLDGKAPYRDFWYDKPPLAALYYLPIGAVPGVALRLWDAVYVLCCCFLARRLARSWWGEAEGRMAALLLAFFSTFYLPAAVIPFAPDALLIAPHLAAIYFARQGKALAAGAICGVGFWINVKALFVAAACAVWLAPSLVGLAGGFAAVVTLGAAALGTLGMAAGYWTQVWVWGLGYAGGAAVAHPLLLGIARVGHWLGFHAALAVGWVAGVWREGRTEQVKLTVWLAMSFAAVCFGNHFAPRYFLQLLPPLVVVGARGVVQALEIRKGLTIGALVLILLVPLVRFAPRYVKMAEHAAWGDVALDLDSRQAAAQINVLAKPGDTLFVWGYRPDLYVYTRLHLASKFWDSQPLTGVAADRHLGAQAPVVNEQTSAHLRTVGNSRPTFFVDGLGLLNEKLRPEKFAEIKELLGGYREVGRTRLSVIYRKKITN